MTDWTAALDQRSGRTYYYNKVTKVTQWTKPEDFVENNPISPSINAGANPDNDPENTAMYWNVVQDPKTGRMYYYNKATKSTSWTMPECLNTTNNNSNVALPLSPSHAQLKAPPSSPPQSLQILPNSPTDQVPPSIPGSPNSTNENKWAEAIDPRTNRKYWYNRQTRQTTWKKPLDFDDTNTTTDTNTINKKQQYGTINTSNPLSAASSVNPDGFDTQKISQPDDNNTDITKNKEEAQDRAAVLREFCAALESDSEADEKDDEKGMNSGNNSSARVRQVAYSDSDDEQQQFRFAKHRKGAIARFFRTKGSIMNEERILSWKKTLIKKALQKQNREQDEECIQAFKNIMSYMGDRSSSKGPIQHAKKMLRNLMIAPAGLRDEVLVQICKQTNNNPRIESTIKGWEQMRFCLATYPPSKQVKGFLIDYIQRNAASDTNNTSVRRLAKECLVQVEKILLGQRKQIPSTKELEALRSMTDITLDIPLMNGDIKTVKVDSYTTVKETQDMASSKIRLVFTEPFALYEVGATNVERLLDPKERILDVVASWENEPPDAEDNRVGSKHSNEYRSLYNRLQFKAKLVLKLNIPEINHDTEAVNLLYIQAVSDIVTNRYPVKEKDAVILAALQLQATHGDYKPNVHIPGWLSSTITHYIPANFIKTDKGKIDKKLVNEWEDKIMSKYKKFNGFTQIEARSNYQQQIQDWTFYGATFFTIEQRQFRDYPSPQLLGITCEGLLLLHPQKRTVLEYYTYPDIVTWGHSDEKFIVVVGNIVQQRKQIFKCSEGRIINSLVHDYVKFKVRTKSISLEI